MLTTCSRSLYAIEVLEYHGLSSESSIWLHRPLHYHDCYRQPPPGMASRYTLAKDRARIERLLASLIRLNYLPSGYPSYQDLLSKTDLTILESVIFDSHHFLRPILPLSSGVLVCASASTTLTYQRLHEFYTLCPL